MTAGGRRRLPWFRVYVEAFSDRKLRRLDPATRWLFVAVLGASRQSPEPGRLLVGVGVPFEADDLADFAGMTVPAVRKGMRALVEAGIVEDDDGVWSVPRWSARQFESDDVTLRTRRHRGSRNVPSNGQGTFPGTTSDTDTETESETDPLPSSSHSRGPVDNSGLDEVWRAYARCLLARQPPGSIRNAGAWCRSTASRARDEHAATAARWLAEFDLTAQHVAELLADERTPSDTYRRRTP